MDRPNSGESMAKVVSVNVAKAINRPYNADLLDVAHDNVFSDIDVRRTHLNSKTHSLIAVHRYDSGKKKEEIEEKIDKLFGKVAL